jgi:4-alpha-glucanotransferase
MTEAAARVGVRDDVPHRLLARMTLASPGGLAILTAQDILGLGSEARLNTPGVARGNWSWRLRGGQLTPALASWLAEETRAAGRAP